VEPRHRASAEQSEGADLSTSPFSARVFSLVFGLGYAAAVYINYPLFRYYPLVKRFSLHDLADRTLGPAMAWYGWMAIAAIPALVLSAVVPNRWGNRIPAEVFWILPFVMLLAGWYREQSWFH
jgi:hypothetical protein